MKNSLNIETMNEVQLSTAISKAYAEGNNELGFSLEQEAKLLFGEDWRFILNLSKKYESELPSPKVVSELTIQANFDMLQGNMNKCSSEEEWLQLVAEQRELEQLAVDTLLEEYYIGSENLMQALPTNILS